MFKWKKALSLVLAVCVLLAGFTVSASATDRPSIYEVCVTETVMVDGITDTYYTIYTRLLAFAVGQEGEPVQYLVTDGSVNWSTEAITRYASQFCEALEEKGLIVGESELPELITTGGQMMHVYDGEKWIGAKVAFAIENTNAYVLEIANAMDAIVGATVAEFATGAVSGDAVSNFTLNATDDELYGFIEGNMDINAFSIVPQGGTLTHVTTVSDAELPYSIVDTDPAAETEIPAIMADITRGYGALGAPLLNAKNEVIGITTYDAQRDVTLAVSSDDAARELAAREIITTDMPPKEDAASTTAAGLAGIGAGDSDAAVDSDLEKVANLIKYAIFVAIGLVVILVVLLIVRLRRGKGEDDVLDEAELEEQYEQRQREMRQRHRERQAQVRPKAAEEEAAAPPPNIRPAVRPARPAAETEAAPVQTPAASESATPASAPAAAPAAVAITEEKTEYVTMTVVTGKKKGYSQRVEGRTVIGRDPSTCKMLFPASDTIISRTHCALTYIPTTGDIVLEDLDSANGTYSASGRRLIPGKKYRVRLGDKFYLGTEENMIEVK